MLQSEKNLFFLEFSSQMNKSLCWRRVTERDEFVTSNEFSWRFALISKTFTEFFYSTQIERAKFAQFPSRIFSTWIHLADNLSPSLPAARCSSSGQRVSPYSVCSFRNDNLTMARHLERVAPIMTNVRTVTSTEKWMAGGKKNEDPFVSFSLLRVIRGCWPGRQYPRQPLAVIAGWE